MSWIVRRITIQDLVQAESLLSLLDAERADAEPDIFQMPSTPARSEAWFAAVVGSDITGFFCAESGSELLGLVLAAYCPPSAANVMQPYAVVNQLVVRKDMRRRGVGLSIMQEVNSWASKNGARHLVLNVWEFNTGAIAFYERLGYTQISRSLVRSVSMAR